MNRNVFLTALFSLGALSTVWAESLPVYFGTYTTGNSASKGIYRSVLDLDTGKFAPPSLVAEAVNPSFIVVHPNGKFLYAVSEAGRAGTVSAYAIDSKTGDLTFLNRQPSGGSGPCHVTVDHTGRNVLVANYNSGSFSVIPIEANGSLGKPTAVIQDTGSSVNPTRQKGPHAHSVNLSPDNCFVFVPDLGIDKIMIYKLDAEKGTLVPNDPAFARVAPGSGPRHLTFDPNGKFAYVISEMAGTITAFAYNPASGALKKIQTITTLPADFHGFNGSAEVCVHPNGKFLYGSNRGHDSIAVYRIDPAEGTLTFVQRQTVDIETPRSFSIDPTGTFCVVANQGSDSVVVFRINQKTGALEPTGHKISIGKPVCVCFLKPLPSVAADDERATLRQNFLKLHFGLFLHFNMATYVDREWASGYEDPALFRPEKLDCGQWARLARAAGMKYAVLTVKHTGGWCLWDSRYTTHDVTRFINYKHGKGDVVRQFVDAFRARGLKVGFYYCFPGNFSGVKHGNAIPEGQPDLHGLPPEAAGDYVGFIKKQLAELLTRYGPIDLLWIDQWRNRYTGSRWHEIFAYIKSLQPGCLVIANNAHNLRDSDVYSCEYPWDPKSLPPEGNTMPAEVCDKMAPGWFWHRIRRPDQVKSADAIVKLLKLCNVRNANYLLDVPQDRDGLISGELLKRMRQVAALMHPTAVGAEKK